MVRGGSLTRCLLCRGGSGSVCGVWAAEAKAAAEATKLVVAVLSLFKLSLMATLFAVDIAIWPATVALEP